MKRFVSYCAIFGTFAAATSAFAGNDNSSETRTTPRVGIAIGDILDRDDDNDRPRKKRRFGNVGQLIEKFKKDKQEQNQPPKPIDPGMGNGQPSAPEVPTRPGFVWVGDHWERERAPQKDVPLMIVDPIPGQPLAPQGKPGYVWVGDHWERVKAEPKVSGPVVRDHRTPKFGQNGAVVRDHRRPRANVSSAPGGVTVTSRPRPRKPAGGDVTGHGPLDGVVDGIGDIGDALGAAGNAVGIGHGTITPAGPSKPAYKTVPSARVRDHRK